MRDYGAIGNGTADDRAAIQAAINAASKVAGVVYLPDGTYFIGGDLAIGDPVKIQGSSASTATILARTSIDMVTVSNTSGVEIASLGFTGAYPRATVGYGVSAAAVSNLNIHDCVFSSIPDTAVSLSNVNQVQVANSAFRTTGYSGVRLQDPGAGNLNQHVTIQGCTFSDINCQLAGGHAAVQCHGTSAPVQLFISIKNNTVAAHGVGLGLDSLDSSLVDGNQIVGNQVRGEGIAFTGANNQITNNRVNNCGAAGILQWAIANRSNDGNLISGNTCWDNAQGIAAVCGQSGTLLRNLTVTSNRCYSQSLLHPQNYGIQSYNDGTNNYSWSGVQIANNDLRGNAVGPISLAPPAIATLLNNLA
ncbi:MAG TPA: right-handed parallel beta-helix repeat-containing protein [Thermomicrobiaceae bacterium]|nr:right-handed parallel beta-helix repeat-containing protein [Thermomicrobiaceae bacterium]